MANYDRHEVQREMNFLDVDLLDLEMDWDKDNTEIVNRAQLYIEKLEDRIVEYKKGKS